MRRSIRFAVVATLSVLGAFFVPLQASANLPTFSSSEIEAWQPGPWPGNTVSVPAGFPAGSVATLSWKFSGGPYTNSGVSFTVPELVGSTMYVRLTATIPGHADFVKSYIQLIQCKMPDLAVVFEPGFPTPNTPATMRITNPVPDATFKFEIPRFWDGYLNVQTVKVGEEYRLTVPKRTYSLANSGWDVKISRSKTQCFRQEASVFLPSGPQYLGEPVFGPETGSEFRVGIPVILKRFALTSGNTTLTYRWKVAGVEVATSPSYTPKATDVGKDVELDLEFRDSAAGWHVLQMMYREFHNVVLPAPPGYAPTPTPSPTPSASSRLVLNPQVPSQPRENVGGNPAQSPKPSPSVSQSARPSTSPSPTSNPIPSARPSVSPRAVVYNNCTALRIVFRNGVARDSSSLNRYKLKTKPVLNNSVYLANARLDTDKDGLVCER